jgi:murein DD-endopeptidase MepM/ murein hydrolase activator NlpD
VAAKNVAVAAAAVPTRPSALLSAGCLDGRHGNWLNGELDAAGQPLPAGLQRPVTAAFAGEGEGGEGSEAAGDRAEPVAAGCVPFAAVRSPADRIESLAFLPAAAASMAGDPYRVMVVSRTDLGSTPTTRWHDLAELPAGQREVWMQASGVLAGEAAEQVPHRWQRDVSVLTRQMKRLTQAADTAWLRLVLSGEGEATRVDAVELVDDATGRAIDSAIWIDRADGPGGFVSAVGGDHERVLWQSPVDYRRISRGVGFATMVVRQRVLAKPKTPGGKPRVVVRSFRTRGQHQGIDFAAPAGTPVVTVADGTVVHAGPNGGYGNLVVVDHGGGITTYYAHLSAFAAGVQEGARVERGQEIGQVGSTGRSTGPHLHYEIRRDGQYLDPANAAHTLPNWGLSPDEHHAVLTRLLALSMSRQGAQARATRQPALASAPAAGTSAAE